MKAVSLAAQTLMLGQGQEIIGKIFLKNNKFY
jgi:hypothetical protein